MNLSQPTITWPLWLGLFQCSFKVSAYFCIESPSLSLLWCDLNVKAPMGSSIWMLWSLACGAVWESCRTFRRWTLTGLSRSGLEALQPGSVSCFFLASCVSMQCHQQSPFSATKSPLPVTMSSLPCMMYYILLEPWDPNRYFPSLSYFY